eukprot:SAG22_NODE_4947_length_1123_cov_1.236098_2_plen_103_part_00
MALKADTLTGERCKIEHSPPAIPAVPPCTRRTSSRSADVFRLSGRHTDNSGDRIRPVHPSLSLWIKAFIYLNDVAEDGGCTAVVPFSHRFGEFRQPSLDPAI